MKPSIKILLVEDNPYDAELLREMLLGVPSVQFEWVHVPLLGEALKRLREEKFDAILLDLSLPDSQGQETLAKAYAQAHDIPIVVLTGHSDENLAIRTVHQGAQDYLVKGQVDGPTLIRAVRYAIERHRLLTELDRGRQQQLKIKDQFLSHVSHELRSPLAVIHQFVTILLDRLGGDLSPEQTEYLEIILRNVNQLRKMIEDLLEVTRAETGKLALHPQLTPVDELVDEILSALRIAAAGKGIALSEETSADLPLAYADPNRVRQVLMNLIDNAIKFTPEDGNIRVRAEVSPEDPFFVRLAVSDTGCGISAEERQRIFEPMYQVKESIASSRKGLGLGLFICEELVSRHGGRIWVESEPGKGSTFYFTLPIFSLAQQLTPLLHPKNLELGSVSLISVEISSPDRRQLTKADEGILWEVDNILKHCTLIDKDFLLPRMAPTKRKEFFFIIAFAQRSGTEILQQRIQDQFRRLDKLREAGLEARITYQIFPIPKAAERLPRDAFVKDLNGSIKERIRRAFQEEESR
jgi:sigma-B regulation protein RsbU (phosphoserine phosphatase)